jgi:hypothetical protein
MPDDPPAPTGPPFPRVPGYAWTWFQRSRPVVVEAAERLTGRPPSPGFVDDLRGAFVQDAFTRAVVIGVVADVAFGGKAPLERPPGASWDRGLTWWAAALAGTTPAEFEGRKGAPLGNQRPLFEVGGEVAGQRQPDPTALQAAARTRRARLVARSPERAALAAALRELLDSAAGDQIPANAVRQLLAQLEDPGEG